MTTKTANLMASIEKWSDAQLARNARKSAIEECAKIVEIERDKKTNLRPSRKQARYELLCDLVNEIRKLGDAEERSEGKLKEKFEAMA